MAAGAAVTARRQRIGAMRSRVTLQAPVETDDGAGGVVVSWVDVASVWAEVRPRRGGEGLWADAPAGRLTSEIVMRWRDDVWPGMRLVAGERTFDIRAAYDPDGRRRRVVCLGLEGPL